jgi:hypothetical protein
LFPKRSHLKQSELSDRTVVPGRIVIILDISEELFIMPDELSLPHGRPYTPVISGSGWGKAPYKKYPNPVYLPGSGYHHGTGPIERIEFAIAKCKGPVHFTKRPPGLNPDEFRKPGLDPYIAKKMRWALSRGSVGSYHNERLQVTARDPLHQRMERLLTETGTPYESSPKCECGGIVRYDEQLAMICDDCLTFHGYKVATDNFMNSGGEEEESGDDDAWKAEDVDGYDETTKIPAAHINRRQQKLWYKEQREAERIAWHSWHFDPNHKNDHINHDTRVQKSEYLDYRICLLFKNNGDGMEQADIKDKFEHEYGQVLTSSAVKTAINRMESMGRIETGFIFDRCGKRKIVRLVTKT